MKLLFLTKKYTKIKEEEEENYFTPRLLYAFWRESILYNMYALHVAFQRWKKICKRVVDE